MLQARVEGFSSTCASQLTSIAGDFALAPAANGGFDNVPTDCDRVCGPRCQALKAGVTGLRVSAQVRSSSN